MCTSEELIRAPRELGYPARPFAIVSSDECVLSVEGPLRAPIEGQLRHKVQALLGRGERKIVLDLARVTAVDAAGVGQLVRAYNMAVGVNGALRIAHPNPKVRSMLDRVGLLDLLSAYPDVRQLLLPSKDLG